MPKQERQRVVNGVCDIQYSDDTDKENQHLAQHFDLFKAFCYLVAALETGKPVSFIILFRLVYKELHADRETGCEAAGKQDFAISPTR